MAEGYKTVIEFINSGYQIEEIYHTIPVAPKLLKLSANLNINEISLNELTRVSSLSTPPEVIALIRIPQQAALTTAMLKNNYTLVLDGVQDPGNMGTIIRTADWFGMPHIICSDDFGDVYNPKVVQATMGSLARVKVHYTALQMAIPALQLPVYGALLNGANIYNTNFAPGGLILLGNEGNGIRPDVQRLIGTGVTIPRAGAAESLNVAVAAAIFCSEACRNRLK